MQHMDASPFLCLIFRVTNLLFFEDGHFTSCHPHPHKMGQKLSLSEIKEKGKAIGKSWLTPLAITGLSPAAQGFPLQESTQSWGRKMIVLERAASPSL